MPRQLGDGLLLRWAVPADSEELADFNLRWHREAPGGEPELWLREWTKDLINGRHPTASSYSVTVVVDQNRQDKIVSSMAMIPQTWAYDGLTFGCGRPELIATDPDYRRGRLARIQVEQFHAQSEARGDLVQAITGIPWFYRQFGYETALDLGGGRMLTREILTARSKEQIEHYQMRKATIDDLPFMEEMYDQMCSGNLISCLRDQTIWQYELDMDHEILDGRRNLCIVQTNSGLPVAYAEILKYPHADTVRELEVAPGHNVRAIALFIARQLLAQFQRDEIEQKQPAGITFKLGANHAAYQALQGDIGPPKPAYAWYLRVPDLPRFIRHISPVLGKRISASDIAGYSGTLRLNFYQRQLKLEFSRGQLAEMAPYVPKQILDGDAFFRDLTFLQLLFGYRSMDELNYAQVDCFAKGSEVQALLQTLFPKVHSKVVPVS